MQTELQSYWDYLRIERQVSPHTLANYQRQLNAVLKLLAEQDIRQWQQITPNIVRFVLVQSKKAWIYVCLPFGDFLVIWCNKAN